MGAPLWVTKIGAELLKDSMSLRPSKWQSLENAPPQYIAFNVTEFCNSLCSFCCYKTSKPRYTMSNEIFFKAAKEYHDVGGRKIWLNALTGEPLLDPDFFSKTSILQSLGNFNDVVLTTNGILLNKENNIESIINSGISKIEISTAGFEKSVYEKVMGVRKYDEFLSGLSRLITRNQECGNPISITIFVRGSIDAADTNDFSSRILPLIDSSGGKVTLSFWRLLLDWIGQVKEGDIPDGLGFMPRGRIRIKPCRNSFGLGILANGDIRLCNVQYGSDGGTDDLTLGNLKVDSLCEVWNSSKTRRVRRTTYGPNSNKICVRCRCYEPIYHQYPYQLKSDQ